MNISEQGKRVKRIVFIVIASFISAVNINTFIEAGGLFPGGFNGLTILIQRSALSFAGVVIPFSLLNYSLNAIPAIVGLKTIGKKFTFYSCLMILLTGMFVEIIPTTPITYDPLLISVFGGIINGVAIGLALSVDASGGGTDFIAIWLSKKLNAPAWNYILVANGVMYLIAGSLFGWDKALYSIIFQFCSTQMISVLHQRYKRMTVYIITKKPEELSQQVMNLTHHGVTSFDGVGEYSNEPRTMLFTIVSVDEVKPLVRLVREIDQTAFINVTKSELIDGRFYQKPLE